MKRYKRMTWRLYDTCPPGETGLGVSKGELYMCVENNGGFSVEVKNKILTEEEILRASQFLQHRYT
jgi:hypothetical protein